MAASLRSATPHKKLANGSLLKRIRNRRGRIRLRSGLLRDSAVLLRQARDER